ncbi:methyl-accepting chemotaxis protein [Thalassotalea atypica]|uniref:methyl-accepting chemotaxis protein n=1 Tax=Thalassotalea atypica TaxID=2054316 RepID=UPI0025748AB1|nr:methyl-accepting chemotaxis protein [Thalassotalea atypica]
MKLKNTLLVTFVVIGLLPTLLTSLISNMLASNAIETQAFNQLISVRENKRAQIEDYYQQREHDISLLAATTQKILTSQNIASLTESAHDNHDYFKQYIETYGYYDFFVIDNHGQIVYTVTKEADYQTNLLNGAYQSSGLAALYRRVQQSKVIGISDFSRYAPSNNEPAGFIAHQVKIDSGTNFTIALQLSLDKINDLMKERAGMGETGESYLIGPDLLMRSDSFLDPTGHSVIASFAGNVKNNGVDTEAARLALNGKTGSKIIIDYNGNPVLSAYTSVDIDGTRWGLLSEIDVAEAFQPVTTLQWTIFTLLLICALIIVAAALICSKSVLKPLGGEPNDMQEITETIAEGNLTVAFDHKHANASVYGAMKRMTSQLQVMVGEIISNSHHLASVSEQTSALSLQSSTSLKEQQSNIEQAATAIEEMSMTINEVAHNAANVSSSSQSAKAASINASQMLTSTVDDLEQLDDEITKTSLVIESLEAGSNEIGSVLEVIRGIAEQTNLLALNAAIEAARAGEQGRGFAVVADEVRTLASKTQESTSNIESMIENLQNSSNEAVAAMSSSRSICEHTKTNAETTSQAIKQMSVEIDHISEMTELIATSVEEQSCVSTEISQNVTQINDAANENSASAEQVTTASEHINAIAESLNQLTLKFKIAS